ncbi:MAG: U32 family peptidase [Clostridiales bacterium]|nr:U32 family peptidase [Clostridiales bacterium]
MKKPELLAPAGDFEKLQFAIAYGADAVYLGAKRYSLRAMAKNFDEETLRKAVRYAHNAGCKVYAAANIFARNDDLTSLPEYFSQISQAGVDACIVSDPGVFSILRDAAPEMNIHISTQANNTNYMSAVFWQRLGAKRIVLARELSFKEASEIRDKAPGIELEYFVHGAMCISYSGRCLLSNFMAGRDSNRGACAHPCRYKYSLVEETRPGEYLPIEEDSRGSYIMNSKDLCLIGFIPQLIEAGISSFKIEGRMKSAYYVAATVKAYREAIDDWFSNRSLYESKKGHYLSELKKAGNRGFCSGFFEGGPDSSSLEYNFDGGDAACDFLGTALSYDEKSGLAVIEQRNKFSLGEDLEFFTPHGKGFTQNIKVMLDMDGFPIKDAPHPKQLVMVGASQPVAPFSILRRPKKIDD